MKPAVTFIQKPAIDFDTFLSVTHQGLGYSPAEAVDGDPRQLPDAAKFAACLARFHDRREGVVFPPHLLAHCGYSVLLAAPEQDVRHILECAAGMAFVTADTLTLGVLMAVITGTLAQWRGAVVSGTQSHNGSACRDYYCAVHRLFEQAGFAQVWHGYDKKPTDESLYVLEVK